LHHLNRPTHHPLGCFGGRPGRLRIRVDQNHHIGGPVRQPLGDMQAATPCTHRPVDRAQLIAGHVTTDVRVLNARSDVAGQMGSQPIEQLGARYGRRLWRGQREHENIGGVNAPRALG
jgi:hypothetical protein